MRKAIFAGSVMALAAVVPTSVIADSGSFSGYQLVKAGKHPWSANNAGPPCENLSAVGDVAEACARHTLETGYDYFFVYKKNRRGRCCPKP